MPSVRSFVHMSSMVLCSRSGFRVAWAVRLCEAVRSAPLVYHRFRGRVRPGTKGRQAHGQFEIFHHPQALIKVTDRVESVSLAGQCLVGEQESRCEDLLNVVPETSRRGRVQSPVIEHRDARTIAWIDRDVAHDAWDAVAGISKQVDHGLDCCGYPEVVRIEEHDD
jgi:hypothetical protein